MNEKFYGRTVTDDCGCDGNQRNVTGQSSECGCGHYGRRNETDKPGRMKLLKKVQEYNFMMIEAALFLNNQPCCEAAKEAFCKYQKMYLETLAEYEECYGPLTYKGVNSGRDGWSWVDTPWPWEVEDC